MVNKGSRIKSKTSNEVSLNPFNFCSACGQWLHEQEANTHIDNCSKKGKSRNLYDKLWLFIEGIHDVIEFNFHSNSDWRFALVLPNFSEILP